MDNKAPLLSRWSPPGVFHDNDDDDLGAARFPSELHEASRLLLHPGSLEVGGASS